MAQPNYQYEKRQKDLAKKKKKEEKLKKKLEKKEAKDRRIACRCSGRGGFDGLIRVAGRGSSAAPRPPAACALMSDPAAAAFGYSRDSGSVPYSSIGLDIPRW